MSQPESSHSKSNSDRDSERESPRNDESLIRQDAPYDKEQASTSLSSGAEVLTNEERERQRNEQSLALEDAGDPRLTEPRTAMEGIGGAGEGDLSDVGAVGYPEEAGGGPVSRQQRDFVDGDPDRRLDELGSVDGSDAGAPWERVADAARLDEQQQPDPRG